MRARVLGMAIVLVVGCAAPIASASDASASFSPIPLSLSNGTTITVELVVNGDVVATVAPGAEINVPTGSLPPRPWAIETRSPSGHVLSALSVSTTDYYDRFSGRAVRADLSCGRLDVWLGPPMHGPVFVPGPSGDCV